VCITVVLYMHGYIDSGNQWKRNTNDPLSASASELFEAFQHCHTSKTAFFVGNYDARYLDRCTSTTVLNRLIQWRRQGRREVKKSPVQVTICPPSPIRFSKKHTCTHRSYLIYTILQYTQGFLHKAQITALVSQTSKSKLWKLVFGRLFWSWAPVQCTACNPLSVALGVGTHSKVGGRRSTHFFCRASPLFWLHKYN